MWHMLGLVEFISKLNVRSGPTPQAENEFVTVTGAREIDRGRKRKTEC